MKKIILLSAILSFGTLNADQILKAEPAEKPVVLTLQDAEIAKIKVKIAEHNKKQEEMLMKYDDISYLKEKDLYKLSNVTLHDKKGVIKSSLRIGDVLFSSLDDARNMKLIINNIKLTKAEIEQMYKDTGEEITPDEKQQIDSIFMLAGTDELTIKLNIIANAIEAEGTMMFDQLIEIENFGRLAFIVKASNVDKSLFSLDIDPSNLNKAQEEKLLEMTISDFELNVESLFSFGKLRNLVGGDNYKEIINKQLAEIVKQEEKTVFEKDVEMKILEAIRDDKDVIVKLGVGKDFTIMEGIQTFMMAMMNPQFAMSTMEVYIKAETK